MDLGHWENHTGISDIDFDDYTGFIYRIVFDDGSYYWGKKKFWNAQYKYSKWKTGKKRRTRYYTEADWRSYLSSSDQVQEKIREGIGYKAQMIAVFTTARTLGYAENLAIINSGSYEDIDLGINWRLEKVQGKLGMKDTDDSQLSHLKTVTGALR